ncbi:MAG: hypothetical protein DRO67_02560 [Candidatus Asgardarchaeum californiense]|nr:MAG: hypothetical protein DRO67_02560 [Candidatus Asgardarchaeum californiense]
MMMQTENLEEVFRYLDSFFREFIPFAKDFLDLLRRYVYPILLWLVEIIKSVSSYLPDDNLIYYVVAGIAFAIGFILNFLFEHPKKKEKSES